MAAQEETRPLIRIFISSPGDVQLERDTARSVIDKLSHEYTRFADIKAVLWEELPLTPATTFQEGINKVLEEDGVDIAVFILANRLGSCPGTNLRYPDGRLYRSGTEYEYDFMKKLRVETGKPEILVYVRKKGLGNLNSQGREDIDEEKILEAIEQKRGVENFIKEEFEDKELGAFLAFHTLTGEVNFESRLTEHLRELLQRILSSPALPRYEGNPYKGLLSFEPEDAPIFFGRGLLLQLLKSKIIDFYNEKSEIPYIFICGESGSGKSSFAKAGLVQALLRTGVIEPHKCEVKIFTPQHTNGKFSAALLDHLKEMLPALGENKYFTSLYETEDISERDAAIIDSAIEKSAAEKQKLMPAFLIDQFEEFFSDNRITPEEREKSIALLSALQKTGKIMVIFTLRSDYYHYVTSHEELLNIKNSSIMYDIVHLSASDLQEVIEEPARAAGLEWELDLQSGETLNTAVYNEALHLQSLPLLEFALSNLYENRKNNLLTYEFYRQSGGLHGAIENYANDIFNSFSPRQKQSFFDLLGMSVTLTENGKFCRYNVVEQDFALPKEDKEVLEILIQNRLFTRSTTSDGRVCFSVTHEFLLQNWQVARNWCEQEKEFLEKLNLVKIQAAYWEKNHRNKSCLLSSDLEIEEAKSLLQNFSNRLPETLKLYLTLSIRAKNRKKRWLTAAVCSIVLVLATLTIFAFLAQRQAKLNEQNAIANQKEAEKQQQRAEAGEKLAKENAAEAKANEQKAREQQQRAEEGEKRAQKNEAKAKEQAEIAKKSLEFLRNVFRSADPTKRGNKDIKVLDVLKAKLPEIETLKPWQLKAAVSADIGLILSNLGEYDKALYLQQQAFQLNQQHRPVSNEMAASYNAIAFVHAKQGKYGKALEYYCKSLAIFEKVLGKNHPNVATCYNNIGIVHSKQGDYGKALEYYYKSLAIREKALGKNHPDVAISYNNIGIVHYKQGDYRKAFEYFKKSLAITEKVLGKNHPNVATCYSNIGLKYSNQGEYGKALEYFKKSLAITEKVLGKNHPNVATCYSNIGLEYSNQGEYGKALEYYYKSLAIREKALEKNHPDVAISYNNIGIVHYKQGKYAEAELYFQKAATIARKVLGEQHPSTKLYIKNLQYVRKKLKK